jgi:hypothetical protein
MLLINKIRVIAANGLVVFAALSMASVATAVEVPGKVIYKMPSRELVTRDVSLDVPPMGQGKVIWKSANSQMESHAFKTTKKNGRITFSVLFLDPPGAPANTAMVITGAYLRGTNQVIYYGDVYSKQYEGGHDDAKALLDDAEKGLNDDGSGWTYAGGFKFGKELTAQ